MNFICIEVFCPIVICSFGIQFFTFFSIFGPINHNKLYILNQYVKVLNCSEICIRWFFAQVLFVSIRHYPPYKNLALWAFMTNYILHCPSMPTGRPVELISWYTRTNWLHKPILHTNQWAKWAYPSCQPINWMSPPIGTPGSVFLLSRQLSRPLDMHGPFDLLNQSSMPTSSLVESTSQHTYICWPLEPTLHANQVTNWVDLLTPCRPIYGLTTSEDQFNYQHIF